MAKPVILHNPFYDLLRAENIAEFNRLKAEGGATDGLLVGGDFRGLDLRTLDADDLDLHDAYFRGADLRGIDFRKANIEGISLCQAHISGCYFPKEVSAEEIRLSLDLGTRIRCHVS